MLPLLISFTIGKNSSNRAKHISRQLKVFNQKIAHITKQSSNFQTTDTVIDHSRKTIKFGSFGIFIYLVLDYFFLQSETLVKLVRKFGTTNLVGYVGILVALWFLLGFFKSRI